MMDELWLIGTGPMGVAYSEVLVNKNVEFRVVGRGEKSASAFRSKTGLNAQTGGIHNALSVLPPPKLAIVAVQEVHLYETTMALIRAGCKRVLIEKPGALAFSELEKMDKDATIAGTELYVAYNRRFHSSVSRARELIESDGGLQSIDFDFTEFSSVVENLPTANETKERWLLANSSHVLDLVFFLAGIPKAWKYFQSGSLDWHSSGKIFSGAGITLEHKVFSYLSDWGAPGRWRIEVRTSVRKLLLQPLEGLKEMSRSSFEYGEVELDVELDQKFKPGVWQMTTDFLDGREGILCTLNQHILHSRHYFEIAGYPLG